jgi:NADH:quinone reductase (non-electrogenic)
MHRRCSADRARIRVRPSSSHSWVGNELLQSSWRQRLGSDDEKPERCCHAPQPRIGSFRRGNSAERFRRPPAFTNLCHGWGGFAGAETTGAINDFVRETVRYYPNLNEELIRVVVIHPGDFLLPELGQELGDYAESKLRERKVDVIKGVRVASYDGSLVTLTDGNTIPASTLIWTAGVKPSPVIAPLPCEKQRGRLLVSEYLAVTGVPGLWAAGDCAAVPVFNTENFHPPTAQHGLRQGRVAAKNIAAMVLDRPLKPFIFTTLGQLATIGRRKGVAMVFGIKFSGFAAWVFWRTVYLMKLPRLAKKLRVMVGWTLDLLFARDIAQVITLRDAEALGAMANRVRARATQGISVATASTPDFATRDQLK